MKKVTFVCELNPGANADGFNISYPNGGMDTCLYELFVSAGYDVTWIKLSPTDDGSAITDEILESTSVMVWWGHAYHHLVLDSIAKKVAARVHRGMGFIALHSSHISKPFQRLMGTTCYLSWREAAERERVWCIDTSHPIVRGIPESFVIEHEEMYGEPFDIPTPDELVFIGWFKGGEVMRSGCVWRRGRGKVFFFQPGHETFPTYKNGHVRRIILNAIEYIMPDEVASSLGGAHVPVPLEPLD